jgi:hypothetical protein
VKRLEIVMMAVAGVVIAVVGLWFALTFGGHGAQRLSAAAGFTGTPAADSFTYAAGTAGTYIVPAGFAATSVWAHNTSGGGTLTIAPSGPRELSACAAFDAGIYDAGPDADAAAPSWWGDAGTCLAAGASIVIPAASDYELAIPTISGGPDELGDGTVFVFTGTDSYVVTLQAHP